MKWGFNRGLNLAWLALCWLTLMPAWPVRGAFTPEQVPTFKIRARVVSSPEAKGSFRFQIGTAGPQKADAGAWSDWMAFDRDQIEKNLKGYPAIYLKDFPIVTGLRVEPVSDPTMVEAEVMFDGKANAILLKGELFGPFLRSSLRNSSRSSG